MPDALDAAGDICRRYQIASLEDEGERSRACQAPTPGKCRARCGG